MVFRLYRTDIVRKMLKSRFRSRSDHNLDPKGRLNFPRRFCDVLATLEEQQLMVAPYKNHLRVYPIHEWDILETKLLTQAGQHGLGDFVRYFVGGVVECNLDKQGRVLIPLSLRAEVGLERDVVLNGMISWIEIWDAKVWADKQQVVRDGFDDFSDGLSSIGIY